MKESVAMKYERNKLNQKSNSQEQPTASLADWYHMKTDVKIGVRFILFCSSPVNASIRFTAWHNLSPFSLFCFSFCFSFCLFVLVNRYLREKTPTSKYSRAKFGADHDIGRVLMHKKLQSLYISVSACQPFSFQLLAMYLSNLFRYARDVLYSKHV